MVKFQRRNMGCWDRTPPDYVDRLQGLPILEFDTEECLLTYVRETLPWLNDYPEEYQLRIKNNRVTAWTVMGYIL